MFATRREAGQRLAEVLKNLTGEEGILRRRGYGGLPSVALAKEGIVLAVPRGGVPVGYEVAKSLGFPLDILPVRKVAIPWNPEAGFAAVAPGDILILNEDLTPSLGLTDRQIKTLADETLAEVGRRVEVYREGRPAPDLRGKMVILVDDGLASGITMLAGVSMVKKESPEKVVVASPVASGTAVAKIKPEVDRLVVLYTHPPGLSFAVASFYDEWYDLTDEEVKDFLKQAAESLD
ncbi:MAG: phosphoribosyltransferase family protein [Actinomycetota bacterium]